MAASHLPPQWRERVLAVVAGKVNDENLRLMDAWQRAEGGTAQWNPLNTTYKLNGSTAYNTAGVQNYFRATEGVCATALTLVSGLYGGILGDLQAGLKTATQIVVDRDAQFRMWGTDPQLMRTLLAE